MHSKKCLICISGLILLNFRSIFCLNSPRHQLLPAKSRCRVKMEIFQENQFGKRVWDAVWRIPLMQQSKQGSSPTQFGDAAQILKANIMQVYRNEPSYDGAPIAKGEIEGLLEGSLFLGLQIHAYNSKMTITNIARILSYSVRKRLQASLWPEVVYGCIGPSHRQVHSQRQREIL